jgi:UTP--glucose-1-phosphate uridylyltransferase
MIDAYKKHQSGILACLRIEADADYDRYGIVGGDQLEPGLLKMKTIIEKPGKAKAPSNLASLGGYLLTPDIFPCIREALTELERGKEFYIQTAMQKLIDHGSQLLAFETKGTNYYDTGNKLDYLKTVVDFALQRDDIKEDFRAYLRSLDL